MAFVCSKHGRYTSNDLSNDCPWCIEGKNKQETDAVRANFIVKAKKLHRNKYNYDRFVFVDFLTPGAIRCKKHGVFEISPAVHILHKMGCPKCSGSISKGETEWLDELGVKERNNILVIGNKSIRPDGIDRKNKIVYEYLGDFWHGNPKIYNPSDRNPIAKKTFGKLYQDTLKREALIVKAGYKVVSIWESDYNNAKKMRKVRKRKK